MNNPRLAGRYAKSLIDLAVEQNQLPRIWEDVQFLQKALASSSELRLALGSPVITSDKKSAILNAVAGDKLAPTTLLFLRLLIEKTRVSNLLEILNGFEEQYYTLNNIQKIKFTSATPVSESIQENLKQTIKAQKNLQHIEWEAAIDESLIGGYKIQIGELLIDASISHDLKDIQRQFLNNDYIHKIR